MAIGSILGPIVTLVLAIRARSEPIRLWCLSDGGQLGTFTLYTELWLREMLTRGDFSRDRTYLINPGSTPNSEWTRRYEYQLRVVDDRAPLRREVMLNVRSVRGIERRSAATCVPEAKYWSQPNAKHFSDSEINDGLRLEKQLGISQDERSGYACFGVRSDAYYLSHEHYRRHYSPEILSRRVQDASVRNPSLTIMVGALRRTLPSLKLRGVRVGTDVAPLGTRESSEWIVDYAGTCRSEFGDVWLSSHARFLISGASGVAWMSWASDVPVLMTDCYWIGQRLAHVYDRTIPSLLWSISDRRLLTFGEMSRLGKAARHSRLRALQLESVKNSEDDIVAGIEEISRAAAGEYRESDEGKSLRARFVKVVDESRYSDAGGFAMVPEAFLRKYEALLV